jgi:hypothetical protein
MSTWYSLGTPLRIRALPYQCHSDHHPSGFKVADDRPPQLLNLVAGQIAVSESPLGGLGVKPVTLCEHRRCGRVHNLRRLSSPYGCAEQTDGEEYRQVEAIISHFDCGES